MILTLVGRGRVSKEREEVRRKGMEGRERERRVREREREGTKVEGRKGNERGRREGRRKGGKRERRYILVQVIKQIEILDQIISICLTTSPPTNHTHSCHSSNVCM